MDAISELAKLLKERENKADYSPLFGEIIELPYIKNRLHLSYISDILLSR